MRVTMRDYREPRDWRLWREPPGFFMPNCTCCPTNPCTACSSTQFTDDFTSAPSGYSEAVCSAQQKLFAVSGGFLTDSYAGAPYAGCAGVYYRAITIPALSGLCISVSADIHTITGKTTGVTGVFIGGVGQLNARTALANYGTLNNAASNGCGSGGTQNIHGTYTSGDRVTLCLEDTSSGAGTYSLKSYINGVLSDTFTSLAKTLTAGGSINVGFNDTNGGKWTNLSIATN